MPNVSKSESRVQTENAIKLMEALFGTGIQEMLAEPELDDDEEDEDEEE